LKEVRIVWEMLDSEEACSWIEIMDGCRGGTMEKKRRVHLATDRVFVAMRSKWKQNRVSQTF
jgi:hypothetical protein